MSFPVGIDTRSEEEEVTKKKKTPTHVHSPNFIPHNAHSYQYKWSASTYMYVGWSNEKKNFDKCLKMCECVCKK